MRSGTISSRAGDHSARGPDVWAGGGGGSASLCGSFTRADDVTMRDGLPNVRGTTRSMATNVFILGAGASREGGAPLMFDFPGHRT